MKTEQSDNIESYQKQSAPVHEHEGSISLSEFYNELAPDEMVRRSKE